MARNLVTNFVTIVDVSPGLINIELGVGVSFAPKDHSSGAGFKMLRVAVVGGGPSGSCAAEVLAKAGIETWLFERKLDNAKPCGGAIPLCMVEEFDLPESIIDRKVRRSVALRS